MNTSHLRKALAGFALAIVLAACGSSTTDIATDNSDAADTASAADATSTETESGDVESSETDSGLDTTVVEPAEAEPEPEPEPGEVEPAEPDSEPPAVDADAISSEVNLDLFFDGSIVGDVATVECTLSSGLETMCYEITVAGDPVTYETGPFCPSTITDGADAGGIWFDGTGVYDVDGDFITGLAELYDDDNWMMYDEDGNVLVTETAEEFDLAARPDVDPSLQNHCVEGRLEWLDNGDPITSTVVIPIQPVLADAASSSNGNLGVTLDGIVIAASAPVDAILAAYTIAAFDDCGGHYNPNDGYHLHGAVGCSEVGDVSEGETPMFAYAMDGIPVHSPLEEGSTVELDECNGHETEEEGYHYHANGAEENNVIECLIGQSVSSGDAGGGGGRGERPDGPPPGEEEG